MSGIKRDQVQRLDKPWLPVVDAFPPPSPFLLPLPSPVRSLYLRPPPTYSIAYYGDYDCACRDFIVAKANGFRLRDRSTIERPAEPIAGVNRQTGKLATTKIGYKRSPGYSHGGSA